MAPGALVFPCRSVSTTRTAPLEHARASILSGIGRSPSRPRMRPMPTCGFPRRSGWLRARFEIPHSIEARARAREGEHAETAPIPREPGRRRKRPQCARDPASPAYVFGPWTNQSRSDANGSGQKSRRMQATAPGEKLSSAPQRRSATRSMNGMCPTAMTHGASLARSASRNASSSCSTRLGSGVTGRSPIAATTASAVCRARSAGSSRSRPQCAPRRRGARTSGRTRPARQAPPARRA